ncbi:MAG: TlpA disulfide reductase family protein [Rhodothermales bacterium]
MPMPRWRLAVAAAVVMSLTGCTPRTEAPATATTYTPVGAGQSAPELRVRSTSGRLVPLATADSLTLLNLWAMWCGPCREEFPLLERLHRTYAPRGLRVLAVDTDPDPLAAVTRFASEFDLTFQVAVDTSGGIMDRFRAMGLPSSYLIDNDGVIVASWTGIIPLSAADTIAYHLDLP